MDAKNIMTVVAGRPPHDWAKSEEGQLALDVIEAPGAVLVVCPMAGAESDQLEVYVHHELLTIRGRRVSPVSQRSGTVLHQECFWGNFSRSVILPIDVKGEEATATYANGVLTVRIPKHSRSAAIPVKIIDA